MSASIQAPSVVVVPVKQGHLAKTRLAGSAGRHRADLARAFAADCVVAALRCPSVTSVVAVTDDVAAGVLLSGLGAVVVPDTPDAGLNPALEHGAAWARDTWPGCRVTVLSADLPALRPDELSAALRNAEAQPRAFVADAAGTGTTLLTAGPGSPLRARFGRASRAAHRAGGAVELESLVAPGLRRDVDTDVDLWDAVRLGVGAHTAAVLTQMRSPGR
ncbi:MAG: 2-phospho-L-lactate guanylyltransferase [Actinomycetota bacterium]|nr:2-phospho-L-lactate guanylyltransferase [Actinomycetota bacterium]